MPTPSLLIVPSRWNTGNPGKLYSQIPTNGNGDFNVTGVVTGGTSIGTRFNNIGYIEPITTSGTPRLDYYTSSGVPGCPALLVEPSGTNVLSYSEDFNNAAWGKSAMTVSTGTTAVFTAPDGTTNADKIIATTASGVAHSLQRTGLTSAAYTFSVFAKAGEESVISLWLRGNTFRAEFNLVSGTISTSTVTSSRIENYGNGWYRCSVYDSTAGTTAAVYGRDGGSYAGNGVNGFYLWGAQVEANSVPTSYIPTTTATGSRSADVVSVSGAVSGSIGQTEGTIYLDFSTIVGTNSNVIFTLGDSGSGQNRLRILGNPGRELRFLFQLNGGAIQYDFTRTGAVTSLTDFKIAIAYKSGDIAVAINGVLVNTASSGLTFNGPLNSVELSAATVGFLTQRYRAVALHTTRLTNADLVLLTLPGNNTYLPQAIWDNYLSRPGNTEVPDCLYTRHADLLDV